MSHTTDPFAEALVRLNAAGLHSVRGGSEAVRAPGEGATTVEGDPITREELQEIRALKSWRTKHHRRDEELKAQDERLKTRERELEHQLELARAQERKAVTLEAEVAELRRKAAGPRDEGPKVPDYPENPVDDPDGWRRTTQEREALLRNELRELRQTVDRLSGRVDETGRSVASTVNGSAAFNRVASRNERLFDEFATKQGLSTAETEDLKRYVHAFRIEARGYGQYAEAAVSPQGHQIWEYTPKAIEAAYRSAFPDKWEAEVTERVKKEVGSQAPAGRNGQTQGLEWGQRGVPAKGAPVAELAKYYDSLPQYSEAAVKFMDNLDLDTVKQILEFRNSQEAREMGLPSVPAESSPLGVQDHVVDLTMK